MPTPEPSNPRQPAYGTCPGCGNRRAMKADGTMRSHNRLTPQGYNAGRCRGVDQPPVEES